ARLALRALSAAPSHPLVTPTRLDEAEEWSDEAGSEEEDGRGREGARAELARQGGPMGAKSQSPVWWTPNVAFEALSKLKPLDAEKALETYLEALEALPPPPALVTAAKVDLVAEHLSAALSAAAAAAPLARPRSQRFANAWWTPEVAAASGEARRLANRVYRLRKAGRPDEAVEAAARVVRNRLHALMRREKARAEREEVEGVTEATLWKVVKRKLGGEGGGGAGAAMPPLRGPDGTVATTVEEKRELLQLLLLPVVAEAAAAKRADAEEAGDAAGGEGTQCLEWPELREEQVRSALFVARPFAAAGLDDVPNHVLQTLWDSLCHRLVPLLAASLRLSHLPHSWRDATGVVLRQPKKPDYSNPKAYRLICFKSCVAKLLEAVVARRLAYLANAAGLLPVEHVGGRKGRSAVNAVACFVDEIKRQWRARNVCVGVALNVSQAFPSVRVKRLTLKLEEASLPDSACEWVRSFMTHRTCQLWFEGALGEGIEWSSGLPQGSPLSPMLFLLYNLHLICASRTKSSVAYARIKGMNLLAWGKPLID
ncbi:hypothetical protein JCM10207_001435, partial [Rhodosporidiobolus poonsookiae]